ncbi:MAG TPA: hypothetical protein VKR30_03300 [Candidatus Limnocylindrales bacterium]|nr:hypothetical protein [Candidatus Limnocylindrales bacterium]
MRRGDASLAVGIARPATAEDWWTTILWVARDRDLVDFVDLGPSAGPPPEPPVTRLGPALAGALSGLILEADGRLQLRIGPVIPPADPERPWRTPGIVRFAVRWEPARAAVLSDADLGGETLAAFKRGLEALSRP